MKKVLHLTDKFISSGADPDGITCFVTGKHTHYFDVYHDDKGNDLYVGNSFSEKLLLSVKEYKGDRNEPMKIVVEGIEVWIIDTRPYKTFYSTINNADYTPSPVDDEGFHWVNTLDAEWEEVKDHEFITSIAIKKYAMGQSITEKIVGYNNILIGESVSYNDSIYTVVMVSRLGDFGLSRTGELPYEKRIEPHKVFKVS